MFAQPPSRVRVVAGRVLCGYVTPFGPSPVSNDDFEHVAVLLIPSVSVNIIKVLGKGGFSFVYLAQGETSGVRVLMSSIDKDPSHIYVPYLASIRA